MPTFYCWDEDAGQTRRDAMRSAPNAHDHEDAAEDFARKQFDRGDPFAEITVHVQREDSHETFVYEVTVEPVPHFRVRNTGGHDLHRKRSDHG